jgi:glucosamine-6-phosphate deaminase
MDTDKIGRFVADRFQKVLSNKPTAVIGLTTGNTPLITGIYRELVERERQGVIDFKECAFVNPDEQVGIPKGHPESYYTYMQRHFFDHIRHPEERRFIPNGVAVNPEEECARMEAFIHDFGGIDIQLVGLGINGHICFIEPASALPARSFVTPIAQINRELYAPLFGSLEAVPTHAVTYGWGTVMNTRKLILVAVGERKSEIVATSLMGPITTEIPATLLQLHANAEVILDYAAAEVLESRLQDTADFNITLLYKDSNP